MLVNGWKMLAWVGKINLRKHLGQRDPALATEPQEPWGQQAQSQQQDGPL